MSSICEQSMWKNFRPVCPDNGFRDAVKSGVDSATGQNTIAGLVNWVNVIAFATQREHDRNWAQGMSFQELVELAGTPAGKEHLMRAWTELRGEPQGRRIDAAVEMDTLLHHCPELDKLGRIDPAAKQRVLALLDSQRQGREPSAAFVHNMLQLVQSNPFQSSATPKEVREALLSDLSHHPDDRERRLSMESLAERPVFKSLPPTQRVRALKDLGQLLDTHKKKDGGYADVDFEYISVIHDALHHR